jgi:hypothetical protein
MLAPVDPADIRAFARRDRVAVARLKLEHWSRRCRESDGQATLEAGHALYEHARQVRPDFPTEQERAEDLAHHVALKQLLDRAVLAGPGLEELFLDRAEVRDVGGARVPVARAGRRPGARAGGPGEEEEEAVTDRAPAGAPWHPPASEGIRWGDARPVRGRRQRVVSAPGQRTTKLTTLERSVRPFRVWAWTRK